VDPTTIAKAFENYGSLGILVSAFASNLIPGFPAIYLTLVLSYAAANEGDKLALAIAVIAGGLGAGLGKFVEFYISDVLSGRIKRLRRKRESLMYLLKRTKWEVAFLVFLFAALPLPDDVLYIPLGAAGFSKAVFIVSVVLGKIVLTALAAGAGALLGWLFKENIVVSLVVLTVGTALILALAFGVNWEAVVKAYDSSGWRAAGGVLKQELSRLLSPRHRGR
jgi:membrane protein YqaA with SNARE-associated domain